MLTIGNVVGCTEAFFDQRGAQFARKLLAGLRVREMPTWDRSGLSPDAAVRVGIRIESIKAGWPQQKGRHERIVTVTQRGRICIGRRKINLSTVFAGQFVGVREVADDAWLVSFMEYDLGLLGRTVNRVEPVGVNPFALKVLPMSSE